MMDRTRLAGPLSSKPINDYLNDEYPKNDQPFRIKLGYTQDNGSAYVEMSGFKIVASVFGPHHRAYGSGSNNLYTSILPDDMAPYGQTAGRFNVECRFAPFSSFSGRQPWKITDEQRAVSAFVYDALVGSVQLLKYTKSTIDLHILVIEQGYGTNYVDIASALAIVCGSAALVDAGIELFDIVTACAATIPSVVTSEEDVEVNQLNRDDQGSMVFAYMPSLQRTTNQKLNHDGISERGLEFCIEKCTQECLELQQQIQLSL